MLTAITKSLCMCTYTILTTHDTDSSSPVQPPVSSTAPTIDTTSSRDTSSMLYLISTTSIKTQMASLLSDMPAMNSLSSMQPTVSSTAPTSDEATSRNFSSIPNLCKLMWYHQGGIVNCLIM